jgi:lipid-binding SYLF domain-containing protein
MRQRRLCVLSAIPIAIAAFAMSVSVPAQPGDGTAANSGHDSRSARDAQDRVNDAINVVGRMKQDTDLASLLHDARGLYGGLTAGVTDITPSGKLDHAYYQQPASAHEILGGNVTNPASDPLRDALQTHVASK